MKRANLITVLMVLLVLVSAMTFTVGTPVLASSDIVGWWHLDGDALDSSGLDNHGTVEGATFVPGKFGQALSFDGTNDYVSIPDDSNLNIGQGTWEAWIKFNELPSEKEGMMNPLAKANQYWIHASDGSDDPFDNEKIMLSDSIQVKVTVGGTRYIASTDADFIQTGVWYHVAGTYDSDTLSLYVNGELIDTNTDPSGPIDSQETILAIGTWSGFIDYFEGVVDEVRIWNVPLQYPGFILTFPEGSDVQVEVEVLSADELPPCIPPLPDGITPYTSIIVTGSFTGNAEVCFYYDDTGLSTEQEENLRIYMGACVDFNLDGTVNGKDLSLIKKYIKKGNTNSGYSEEGVSFDVNNDGDINDADVDIVKEYKCKGLIVNPGRNGRKQARLPWIDITTELDAVNNLICGETDHFSIFGIR